jgi:hypothetical protein
MSTASDTAPSVTVLLGDFLDRFSPESAEGPKERSITLAELIGALDERAFGLGILILALPCAIPFLYGIPQIVALPMLALAAQLAMGREHPWLPETLGRRKVPVGSLRTVVRRAHRTLGLLERLTAPRLTGLTDGAGARVVGALMLIPAASVLVPLPLTNTTPGIGVGIAAVGLLERDGLLVLLGLFIGLAWVFILIFFGAEAVSAVKDLILARIAS